MFEESKRMGYVPTLSGESLDFNGLAFEPMAECSTRGCERTAFIGRRQCWFHWKLDHFSLYVPGAKTERKKAA